MKPLGTQLIADFITVNNVSLLRRKEDVEALLREAIQKCGLRLLQITSKQFEPQGVTSIAIIGESHISIHTYPEAEHVSLDIFTCASASKGAEALLEYLKKVLQPRTTHVTRLLRGNPQEVHEQDWLTSFSGSGNGFEIRYHVEKYIYSARSQYQQIDIIENEHFGRMLFLDRDVQIAEYDAHLYDEEMVRPLLEDRRFLEHVAILGGGDGGVLREVLRHDPGQVTLVDIDPQVIQVCREHMPSISKGAFEDPRARIVIADANRFLRDTQDTFTGIIYDLTMHPESFTHLPREEFLGQLFGAMRDRLVPGGVISLQCGSPFDTVTLDLLENLLPKYFSDIHFWRRLIPSFCEEWVFAAGRKE